MSRTGLGKLRTGSWAMARGEAPGRWRGTECSRRQQTTETGELSGMQHAVTMHDEAGEAAEGRTLRCCRSTRAQTPPKKPVEQWWLPSILSRLAQAPFQWCNHFPETRSNPTPAQIPHPRAATTSPCCVACGPTHATLQHSPENPSFKSSARSAGMLAPWV